MPVKPTALERLLLYRLHKAPAPVLDLFAAVGFRAATLAIDLGVFKALAAGAETPGEVAEAVDAHPDGVSHLLSFLVPLGYVSRTGEGFANSQSTTTWLVGDEPNLAPWLSYVRNQLFGYWDQHLETTVREGRPPIDMYDWLDEHGGWCETQRGFRATATLVAEDVFEAVALPEGDARLLDVGGGHGYYAIEACRRQPDLRATIIDAPAALGFAREEVTSAGFDDRITISGGDALTDDLGGPYDLAFCFNVAHGYDPETNRALFGRIHDALTADGRLVVLDQFAGEAWLPVARTGLAFTEFVYATALGAKVYEADAMTAWLRDAGFEAVSKTSFRTLPGMGVLEARR